MLEVDCEGRWDVVTFEGLVGELVTVFDRKRRELNALAAGDISEMLGAGDGDVESPPPRMWLMLPVEMVCGRLGDPLIGVADFDAGGLVAFRLGVVRDRKKDHSDSN